MLLEKSSVFVANFTYRDDIAGNAELEEAIQ